MGDIGSLDNLGDLGDLSDLGDLGDSGDLSDSDNFWSVHEKVRLAGPRTERFLSAHPGRCNFHPHERRNASAPEWMTEELSAFPGLNTPNKFSVPLRVPPYRLRACRQT